LKVAVSLFSIVSLDPFVLKDHKMMGRDLWITDKRLIMNDSMALMNVDTKLFSRRLFGADQKPIRRIGQKLCGDLNYLARLSRGVPRRIHMQRWARN
jgi:hypothetical protein